MSVAWRGFHGRVSVWRRVGVVARGAHHKRSVGRRVVDNHHHN
ncbi:hypothetical protein ACXZ9C_10660 [Streptococcus agalactiae]